MARERRAPVLGDDEATPADGPDLDPGAVRPVRRLAFAPKLIGQSIDLPVLLFPALKARERIGRWWPTTVAPSATSARILLKTSKGIWSCSGSVRAA